MGVAHRGLVIEPAVLLVSPQGCCGGAKGIYIAMGMHGLSWDGNRPIREVGYPECLSALGTARGKAAWSYRQV